MAKDATKVAFWSVAAILLVGGVLVSVIPGSPFYNWWATTPAPTPTGARLPAGLPGQIIGQPIGQPAQPGATLPPTVQPAYFGQLASLSVRAVNLLGGSTANVNGELWSNDDTQYVGETQVNGIQSLATNLPNDFDGYVMLGNDVFTSTTDRGTEIYYTKFPVSWRGKQGLVSYDSIPVYAEETATGANLITF